jgi:protein-disulfide isomerase
MLAVAAILGVSCSGAGGGTVHPQSGPVMAQIEEKLGRDLLDKVRADDAAGAFGNGQIHPVALRDDDPAWGPADAPVTLVVFSDFQCPFCGRLAENVRELKARYGDLLRVVFKQFPLPFHAEAMPMAQATLAAHAQGKFWIMHDRLFSREELDDAQLKVWAEQQGLDWTRIVSEVEANAYEARVKEDLEAGEKLGVRGTPSSFINGIQVTGAVPVDTLVAAVDIGLARAYLAMQKGIAPADVHRVLTGAATGK